jgi:hypothetical protein
MLMKNIKQHINKRLQNADYDYEDLKLYLDLAIDYLNDDVYSLNLPSFGSIIDAYSSTLTLGDEDYDHIPDQ